jgi:hypothetical protein
LLHLCHGHLRQQQELVLHRQQERQEQVLLR